MTYPFCPGCGVEHTVECSKPTLCLGRTELKSPRFADDDFVEQQLTPDRITHLDYCGCPACRAAVKPTAKPTGCSRCGSDATTLEEAGLNVPLGTKLTRIDRVRCCGCGTVYHVLAAPAAERIAKLKEKYGPGSTIPYTKKSDGCWVALDWILDWRRTSVSLINELLDMMEAKDKALRLSEARVETGTDLFQALGDDFNRQNEKLRECKAMLDEAGIIKMHTINDIVHTNADRKNKEIRSLKAALENSNEDGQRWKRHWLGCVDKIKELRDEIERLGDSNHNLFGELSEARDKISRLGAEQFPIGNERLNDIRQKWNKWTRDGEPVKTINELCDEIERLKRE